MGKVLGALGAVGLGLERLVPARGAQYEDYVKEIISKSALAYVFDFAKKLNW